MKFLSRKYGSAKPSQVWRAFQNQINTVNPKSELNIQEIMDTWTTQPGYPVISVTITLQEIKLKQERLYIQNQKDLPTDALWHVPITWTPSNQTDPTKPVFWLYNREKVIKNNDKAEWLIFNVNSTGKEKLLIFQ